MVSRPARSAPLGGGLAAVLLLLAAPSPAAALGSLRGPGLAEPTAPLVGLASLLAWNLTAWLLLAVAVTVGGHLPGSVGGACRATARRVAPVAVRRTVELALGLSVVVGAVGGPPAAAAPGPAGPAPSAAAGEQPLPDLDWPTTTTPAPAPAPLPKDVVVAPGDSLWAIAAGDLAARTGAEPAAVEVAEAWPSWWAANRDVVGPDPHLIQPGIRLTPPAAGPPDGPPS